MGAILSERTAIEWTDATWNPTTGCTRVSAGCDHCYAERLSRRLLATTYRARLPVVNTKANRRDPFAVRTWPDRLEIPGSWRRPRRVFVNSMSDLFHKDVPEEFVRRCFQVMLGVGRHVYQVLTKRPGRAARFVERHRDLFPKGLPPHVWIGTSVERQSADYRIRHLLAVPASVRFLSCEPLIGALDLSSFLTHRRAIHWVIVGGESGPGARPLDPHWARLVRDQCRAHQVPFFFKQWGGRTPKAGGRELDGQDWNELPASRLSQTANIKEETARRAQTRCSNGRHDVRVRMSSAVGRSDGSGYVDERLERWPVGGRLVRHERSPGTPRHSPTCAGRDRLRYVWPMSVRFASFSVP